MPDLISSESAHGDEWTARIRAEHDRLGAACPCGNGHDLAEVWCSKCAEPAIVEGYCGKHYPRTDEDGRQLPPWDMPESRKAMGYAPRRVPDAITDPWLRRQFAQATGAVITEREDPDAPGDEEPEPYSIYSDRWDTECE